MAKQPTPDTQHPTTDDQGEDYRFPVTVESGVFEFGVLSVRDLIRLRPVIREYWGGPLPINGTPDGMADLNSVEYALASNLAEMQVACRAKPEGWDWKTLRDPDLVWDLWQTYQKARDAFRLTLGGF